MNGYEHLMALANKPDENGKTVLDLMESFGVSYPEHFLDHWAHAKAKLAPLFPDSLIKTETLESTGEGLADYARSRYAEIVEDTYVGELLHNFGVITNNPAREYATNVLSVCDLCYGQKHSDKTVHLYRYKRDSAVFGAIGYFITDGPRVSPIDTRDCKLLKVFQKGTKFSKIIRGIIETANFKLSSYSVDSYLNAISRLNQDMESKNDVSISIHPMDYFTVSCGTNWDSCFHPDNCYHSSVYSLLTSPETAIVYAASETSFYHKDTFKWPQKIWRAYLTYNGSAALLGSFYPNKAKSISIGDGIIQMFSSMICLSGGEHLTECRDPINYSYSAEGIYDDYSESAADWCDAIIYSKKEVGGKACRHFEISTLPICPVCNTNAVDDYLDYSIGTCSDC